MLPYDSANKLRGTCLSFEAPAGRPSQNLHRTAFPMDSLSFTCTSGHRNLTWACVDSSSADGEIPRYPLRDLAYQVAWVTALSFTPGKTSTFRTKHEEAKLVRRASKNVAPTMICRPCIATTLQVSDGPLLSRLPERSWSRQNPILQWKMLPAAGRS